MNSKNDGGENLIRRSITTDKDIWTEAKIKSARDNVSVSKAITELLKMWISEKVEIKDK